MITALLTNPDGSTIGPAAYSAAVDGAVPPLIGIPVAPFSGIFTRGPDRSPVLGVHTDWYALRGASGQFAQVADTQLAVPGRAQPGLMSPGRCGGTVSAVIYAYGYAYSAPVLTGTGGKR